MEKQIDFLLSLRILEKANLCKATKTNLRL